MGNQTRGGRIPKCHPQIESRHFDDLATVCFLFYRTELGYVAVLVGHMKLSGQSDRD